MFQGIGVDSHDEIQQLPDVLLHYTDAFFFRLVVSTERQPTGAVMIVNDKREANRREGRFRTRRDTATATSRPVLGRKRRFGLPAAINTRSRW